MAEVGVNGLWVVVKGERQWTAWRDWMRREFRKAYFPDRMTVFGEWPPETVEGARIVASKVNAIRDQIEYRRVPEWPSPARPAA